MSAAAALPPLLVGLAGVAGAGKDYTFALLRRTFPAAQRISFSAPLKSILVATDPYIGPRERLSHLLLGSAGFDQAKNSTLEVRRLLQRLGTDGIRAHLGQDVFVRAAFERLDPGGELHVFTDVRFDNEVREIRRRGGVIVLVRREGAPRVAGDHVSEQMVDSLPHDFVFVNDGDDEHVSDLLKFVNAYAHLRRPAPPAAA